MILRNGPYRRVTFEFEDNFGSSNLQSMQSMVPPEKQSF